MPFTRLNSSSPESDRSRFEHTLRRLDELGKCIAAKARPLHFEEGAFVRIATEELGRTLSEGGLDAGAIARWVVSTDMLPHQHDVSAHFGQPPITVYAHPRFYIQVIFWVRGETAVHRHSFSGAYAVLQGRSIQIRYRFEPATTINPQLMLGRLAVEDLEFVEPGDVHPIQHDLVHCVFHVGSPTVSLVIRTDSEPQSLPQYSYAWPGVAYDPFRQTAPISRKTQLLDTLAMVDVEAALECCSALCVSTETDISTWWFVSAQLARRKDSDALLDVLCKGGSARFGRVGQVASIALYEMRRVAKLSMLRRSALHPTMSWWLTALMLLPDRASIERMLAMCLPEHNFMDTALACMLRMGRTLGMDFSTEFNSLLIRSLLTDGSVAHALTALEEIFVQDDLKQRRGELVAYIHRLKRSLLAPVFYSSNTERFDYIMDNLNGP